MKRRVVKPRKHQGKFTFDLVLREGNNRLLDVKEEKISALEEVIELLKRKL